MLKCLNMDWFSSLNDARDETKAWREDYNARRPRGSLGNEAPSGYAVRRQKTRTP